MDGMEILGNRQAGSMSGSAGGASQRRRHFGVKFTQGARSEIVSVGIKELVLAEQRMEESGA
jgi:hypothetical protein